MKILIAMLLFVVGSLQASEADLWKQYKELKATSYDSVSLTVQKYVDTAKVASELNRNDIAAWNYNNAGYALINEFRKVTNYKDFNKQISKAKSGEPRKAKRNEFREVLRQHLALLDEAHGYLAQSAGLAEQADVKKKLESNFGFIQWVEGFVTVTGDLTPGGK